MISTSLLERSIDTSLPEVLQAWASRDDQAWTIRRMRPADAPDVKALFRSLHAFNASLDPRFALSEEWESHFDAAMRQVLRGEDVLCLIACDPATDRPQGFALAAIHRDSGMWRCREWVEVEALYVEDACRGCGLAEMLLNEVCAWAEGIGQSVVQLYVTASNERAIRFYRHEGFGQTQAIMRKVIA
jgi:ribosomal protein S18 acetylase RimI-like enzyme